MASETHRFKGLYKLAAAHYKNHDNRNAQPQANLNKIKTTHKAMELDRRTLLILNLDKNLKKFKIQISFTFTK
jgi:hypothetical protein